MPPGEPRLSCHPAYTSTTGDEAIELAEMAGIHLDPWQQMVLRVLLGERPDGKWAAFEGVIVGPRQNGKNEILIARQLAGLFLLPDERLIIHSAHRFNTASEHFERLIAVIEDCPELKARIKPRGITVANGKEKIETVDGSRLRLLARQHGTGRGFTAHLLTLDEAWELAEIAMGAIMPTLSTVTNPQVVYAATAVDQWFHDNGIVLTRLRERAKAGDDPALAYFEWSLDFDSPDEVPDEVAEDPATWARANPALGIRIDREYVSREQNTLPPRQFAVERLGVGDWPSLEAADQVISAEAWKALIDTGSEITGPICVAYDVTPDRHAAAVAVAGQRDDSDWHVEVVEHKAGTGWVAELIGAMAVKREIASVHADSIGPAGALVPAVNELLTDEVDELSTRDYARACGRFFDAVDGGTVHHLGTGELTAAVASATKRPLGEAWAWARSGADISPLVACTIALDGAMSPVSEPEPFVEVFG